MNAIFDSANRQKFAANYPEVPHKLAHALHSHPRGTLQGLLPAGWELWLDGGHNGAAGEALAAFAAGWRDRPLHLVFGMLDTKEPAEFLAPLAPPSLPISDCSTDAASPPPRYLCLMQYCSTPARLPVLA